MKGGVGVYLPSRITLTIFTGGFNERTCANFDARAPSVQSGRWRLKRCVPVNRSLCPAAAAGGPTGLWHRHPWPQQRRHSVKGTHTVRSTGGQSARGSCFFYLLFFYRSLMWLGFIQWRGGSERGREGQGGRAREGGATQTQKEGKRSHRYAPLDSSVEQQQLQFMCPLSAFHVPLLLQRRRKRKKQEQVMQNASGNEVKMASISPSFWNWFFNRA